MRPKNCGAEFWDTRSYTEHVRRWQEWFFLGGGGVGKKAYYCNSLMSPERKLNSPFKDEVTALQSLRNHGVTFPVCRDLFYFVFFGLTRTGKETSAMA